MDEISIQNQISELQKQLTLVRQQKRLEKNEIDKKNSIFVAENFQKEIINNNGVKICNQPKDYDPFFGNSYDIKFFGYPLIVNRDVENYVLNKNVFNIVNNEVVSKNMFITGISPPVTKQEIYLYPYVVSYLAGKLPMKVNLKSESCKMSDGFIESFVVDDDNVYFNIYYSPEHKNNTPKVKIYHAIREL